jgi:hypothetical protein
MDERAQCSNRQPARNGRRSDGLSAAMTASPQHTRAEYGDRDMSARQAKYLQGPLRAHDPWSIQSTGQRVELSIEHCRLVGERD